jgi:hypothetical protein
MTVPTTAEQRWPQLAYHGHGDFANAELAAGPTVDLNAFPSLKSMTYSVFHKFYSDRTRKAQPRRTREDQQEQLTRDLEIDPKEYYPPDVFREQMTEWPEGFTIDLRPMLPHKPEEK